ncbi:MAG: class C beta-lactamase-related serine hydrolase [Actinobacteria bacterium]|nr:MAG: class C beta-lactamase-related serine hydrolase [Actinomycetota bacterium]
MNDLVDLKRRVALMVGEHIDTDTTLGLVVQHRGEVVAEAYADGVTAETTLISWSMAKSITHALVGMAQMDGLLDVQAPTGIALWQNDDRKHITLQHLLEMRSGLAWIEDYVEGNESNVIEMLFGSGKDDHAAYAIDQPLASTPGSVWYYSSGTTNIVARLLGDALGDKHGSSALTRAFIQERLFDVIGMTSATAQFDAAGTFVGSSYVYATARDFAKFGELYLRDGLWEGKRILPQGWVDHARAQTVIDDETGQGYGAHWWTQPGEPSSLIASGYEGQQIVVLPEHDLVIVRLGKTVAEKRAVVRDGLFEIAEMFTVAGQQ